MSFDALTMGVYTQCVAESLSELSRNGEFDRSYLFKVADELQRIANLQDLPVGVDERERNFREEFNKSKHYIQPILLSFLGQKYGKGNEERGLSQVVSGLTRGEIGEDSKALIFFRELVDYTLTIERLERIAC